MTGEYARMSDNAYICQVRAALTRMGYRDEVSLDALALWLRQQRREGIEATGNHAPPWAPARAPLGVDSDQKEKGT